MRELGARLDLDIGGKAAQHVIEQGNLLIGIAARAGRKQVGDPINDLEAVLGGRAGRREESFRQARWLYWMRYSLPWQVLCNSTNLDAAPGYAVDRATAAGRTLPQRCENSLYKPGQKNRKILANSYTTAA